MPTLGYTFLLLFRAMGIFVLLMAFVTVAQSQQMVPVDTRSRIAFEVKNLGVSVNGTLSGLQGNIAFDPNSLEASYVQLRVTAASIQTGISLRDRHLLKEDYLFSEKFPLIEFISYELKREGADFVADGQLKIRGVSVRVVIPFRAKAIGEKYEFEGKFTISRHDFGIGKGAFTMGDEVHVRFVIATESPELSRTVQSREKNNR